MEPVGKDLGLFRQKDPAGVDQVDAWQVIVHGNLLGPDMLGDGFLDVGPALDCRVIGYDERLPSFDHPNPRDDSGGWELVVVFAEGGQRGKLQERRIRVEEQVDALTGEEFSPLFMTFDGFLRRPVLHFPEPGAVFVQDLQELRFILLKFSRMNVDFRFYSEQGAGFLLR